VRATTNPPSKQPRGGDAQPDGGPADHAERYSESATKHAIDSYMPLPKRERHGLALCLSGGGFRAALFHLGALRRLNELGVLTSIDTISSVSGGSIVSAHLAARVGAWPAGAIPDWQATIAAPFYAFAKRNIRTRPLLQRALPWNWRRGSAPVEALARLYQRHLIPGRLSDLPAPPARPRFVFCSSDLTFGVNWIFDAAGPSGVSRSGDYKAGYASPSPDWPAARAVAASSCFPPVFDPLPGGVAAGDLVGGDYDKADRDQLVEAIRLSDGGVYDNLGLEPVWKDHRTLLVSDGGATFDPVRLAGLFWRVGRYTSLVENQARGLRKRWLISSFIGDELDGTYWGIGTPTTRYEEQVRGPARHFTGYSEPLVDDVVSEVRTDIDAFSDAEVRVLENHGYLLAEAAIQTHVPQLVMTPAPVNVPHPEWLDEKRVKEALAESHNRKLLGRR
jgi:NTE family protein